jgi:hypothetical protein
MCGGSVRASRRAGARDRCSAGARRGQRGGP